MFLFFTYSLMLLHSFVGVVLIGIILLQRGRGGGLAGAFGGMGGQSAFGTKAGDVFTKITIVLSTAWIVLGCVCVLMASSPMARTQEYKPGQKAGLKSADEADAALPGPTDGAPGAGAGASDTGKDAEKPAAEKVDAEKADGEKKEGEKADGAKADGQKPETKAGEAAQPPAKDDAAAKPAADAAKPAVDAAKPDADAAKPDADAAKPDADKPAADKPAADKPE